MPGKPQSSSVLIDEDWEPTEVTEREARDIGRVIVAGTRLDNTLGMLLATLQAAPRTTPEVQQRYRELDGRTGLIGGLRKVAADARNLPGLSGVLDRAEDLLEDRHGFAHGSPIVTSSGKRALLRSVTASRATKRYEGYRDVAQSLDPLGVDVLILAMNQAVDDLLRMIASLMSDHDPAWSEELRGHLRDAPGSLSSEPGSGLASR